MQTKLLISILGRLLMIIGLSMSIPLVTAIIYQEHDIWAFSLTMPITTLVGYCMYAFFKTDARMRPKDGYLFVVFGWLLATIFGMMPYVLTGALPHFVDAWFEAMSGFTTTGSSVLNDIESLPHGLLMWRSLTHWLGGLGIIVLFVAILANMGTGNMQIYKAEVPGPISEKIKPRISESAKILWLIYLTYTIILTLAFLVCGMNLFDAINHSFSTIATGGFSTKNLSIGHYNSPLIEWVTIIGMFGAGINFALYFYAFRTKQIQHFFKSNEFKLYCSFIILSVLFITVDILKSYDYHISEALRFAAFQTVSIITTTGFITTDYDLWPTLAKTTIIFLMFIGGCAGSTSGGIKVDRCVILFRQAHHELMRALHPRMVTQLKINSTPVNDSTIIHVSIFFFLYMFIIAVSTIMISGMGQEFIVAFSGVVSSIGNVGPALGDLGPTESYSSASYVTKVIFTCLMLLGRLEIYTVLVLFLPSTYRK